MEMKKVSLITAILILFVLSTFAMAQQQGSAKRAAGGRGGYNCGLANLNLTTEQADKIRVLREAHLKEVRPLRTQMFDKRAQMRLLWMQVEPDGAKIKSLQKEIDKLRGQLQDKRTDHRLAFIKLLTPEQRTQLLAQKGMGRGKSKGKGGRGFHDRGFGSRDRTGQGFVGQGFTGGTGSQPQK